MLQNLPGCELPFESGFRLLGRRLWQRCHWLVPVASKLADRAVLDRPPEIRARMGGDRWQRSFLQIEQELLHQVANSLGANAVREAWRQQQGEFSRQKPKCCFERSAVPVHVPLLELANRVDP